MIKQVMMGVPEEIGKPLSTGGGGLSYLPFPFLFSFLFLSPALCLSLSSIPFSSFLPSLAYNLPFSLPSQKALCYLLGVETLLGCRHLSAFKKRFLAFGAYLVVKNIREK